ncbi:MAG: carboxypeptidase regulatory-like domain-containing protein [Saprospiraceae bacterium]|nr:carboxypeptidase regulatory-like domain-containing protein [Saprospiraceae bacterium]
MSQSKAGRTAAAPTVKSENPLDTLIKKINKSRKYSGTQQNLYTYSKLGWEHYSANLADFTNYSTYYTKAVGDDAIAAITAAEELPSFEALQAGHTTARNSLMALNSVLLGEWQVLADIINKSYSVVERAAMLKAAGADYYADASNLMWDKTATLINMGNTFLKENGATLLDKQFMPSGFPEQFKNAGTAFTAQRTVFIAKEEAARKGIETKAAANEAVYSSLMAMCKSAARIYRDDASMLRLFTVSRLLKEVRGNSPSGIKGRITDATGRPLANVLVSDVDDPSRSVLSDADGKYELKYPSGELKVVVSMEGFVPVELERSISVGTMHRQNFVLSPMTPVEVPEVMEVA